MRIAILISLFLSFASQAWAWGGEGHEIVATLAQHRLKPAARAEAQRLLGQPAGLQLAAVANWADHLRDDDPERGARTARWHYVNFQRGQCQYQPARDCPDGQCVIAAINRNFLALSDRRRPDAERAEALKFLVHFVGDIHQPLHAGWGDDRGGNEFQLSIQGEGSNLHQVWDRKIIASRGEDTAAFAARLERLAPLPFDATGRSDRPAVDWALESCALVSADDFYPRSHTLPADYIPGHQAEVDQRLRQAGARLASMLNWALTRPAPTAQGR